MSRTLRVLIVEDLPEDAELILRELARSGFEPSWRRVETAAGMQAALAEGAWDVILSDNQLPGFGATEALALAKKADPDLPFIVVSGTIGEEAAVKLMRAGASDCILKGSLPRLSATLERELREARNRRDRQRAEESLARDAFVLANVRDSVIVTDLQGIVTYWNQGAIRLFGWTAEERLGRPLVERFPEPARQALAQLVQEIIAGRPWSGEFEDWRKDGSRVWIDARVAAIVDAAGQVIGILGVSHDISDRKQAEIQRDRLLGRLHLQIERMPMAYLLTDADFLIVDWNGAAEQIFGYSKAEMLGEGPPYEKLLPASAWSYAAEVRRRLVAGDMAAHGVNENLTKDGRTIICEWYNTPLIDAEGHFMGLISLAQDITARRRAEESLLLRDRAIQALTPGILITDSGQPDDPIVYASPGFSRLTGFSAEEIAGRNCRFLQGKDTDPAAVALIREAVREGRPCTVELLNYRKDGTSFWNELSVAPVKDESGRLTHCVGVQTDVTERRRLEDQYRQAQRMEAVGQLAGGVAHDFNNLLTVIGGYTDLMLQILDPDDPNRELLDEIQKAQVRSAALTRQLLAFSRKQVLSPKVLDLNEVVRQTESMLRRVIGEDVRLATVLNPRLYPVKADPGQIEQVLLNLAVNARDAMPQGGRLTIETNNLEVDEEFARVHTGLRPGSHVLLAMSDAGTGMSEEVRMRIFEPFFTTKGPGKGTGLGLAVVHGIIQQSGGHIEVESEPGAGATFKIYLPRVQQPAVVATPLSAPAPLPRGTETVLLVEDDDSVRALSGRVLAEWGYAVMQASDGLEALRMAEEHEPPIHLLLTDVVMPRLGGRQLAERLLVQHPETKVLYLSGYTDDAIVRHGILHEQVSFLQKPFSPRALAQKIREVLGKS